MVKLSNLKKIGGFMTGVFFATSPSLSTDTSRITISNDMDRDIISDRSGYAKTFPDQPSRIGLNEAIIPVSLNMDFNTYLKYTSLARSRVDPLAITEINEPLYRREFDCKPYMNCSITVDDTGHALLSHTQQVTENGIRTRIYFMDSANGPQLRKAYVRDAHIGWQKAFFAGDELDIFRDNLIAKPNTFKEYVRGDIWDRKHLSLYKQTPEDAYRARVLLENLVR